MTSDAGASPAVQIDDGEPTVVYRFYASDGALLYVGISCNPSARFAQHAADKGWWSQVVRKTAVLYPSREEAEQVEATAILEESPLHNVAGRREPRTEPTIYKQMARAQDALSRAEREMSKPNVYFQPGPAALSWIDSFAKQRGLGRGEAAAQLLYLGMVKFYDDRSAALDAQLNALDLAPEAPDEMAGQP